MAREMNTSLFFELLQVALGNRVNLSCNPSKEEWRDIYISSKMHALLGITFVGVERLPESQLPPKPLLLQWLVAAEHIKELNEQLSNSAVAISKHFLQDGFRNVVLKGQGIAQYYSVDNIAAYRTPGDVDIWLDANRKDIIRYVRAQMADSKIVYHHMDFPMMYGAEVEVHFTPSWMNDYFTNCRLQAFFNGYREILFSSNGSAVEMPVPTLAFNRVYVLVHIYRHLFHEGIGLRQLMDYYYVLRQGFADSERKEAMQEIHRLKMSRFASAVMWILKDVFGLEECYMITSPNEKEGRFLLNEILRSGNFGQYDKSLVRKPKDSSLVFGVRKLKRIFRFVRSYPSEVLWSPLFKVWHYIWRLRMRKIV